MSGFATGDAASGKPARPVSLLPISPAQKAAALAPKQSSFLNSIESPKEQLELFLWKFKDVDREDIEAKLTEFLKFDHGKRGCLEENEAMQLLEHRGETKTFRELREMVAAMDVNSDHMLSFLEWSCAVYKKDYALLDDFTDAAAREAALAQLKVASEARARVLADMQAAKDAEEERIRLEAEEIERESQLTGVAGKAAFFKRRATVVGTDTTKSNEEKIKAEAKLRKELREAAAMEKAAKEAASKTKSPEEVARELAEVQAREEQRKAEEKARLEAEERAARAARKAAINAKFASPDKTPDKTKSP